jgi:hypothetical protein
VTSDYWLRKAFDIQVAFEAIPKKKGSKKTSIQGGKTRNERATFWESNGRLLRLCHILLHAQILVEERTPCFVCQSHVRNGLQCSLCGEICCSTKCFGEFHLLEKFEIALEEVDDNV